MAAARYATRVALALGQHIVRETMVPAGGRITVGHSDRATFVLALAPARARTPLVKRGKLHLLPGLAGRVVLAGREHDVDELREGGQREVVLGPEDWGVLWLADSPTVRLVVMQVPPEPLPPLPRQTEPTFWASLALSSAAIVLLLAISFLRYDPDRPTMDLDEVDERFTRAMFNSPPKEIPEEEPEISDAETKEEKARKKAGGDEGKFGRPDRTGPSNVPRLPGPSAAQQGIVGINAELLAQKATMDDLLSVGGQIAGVNEGPLIIGQGLGGMGTRGSGSGGGGEGEGQIHGTSDIDMGGGGAENRKRSVKGMSGPAEKKPTVQPGHANVKGSCRSPSVRGATARCGGCSKRWDTRCARSRARASARSAIDVSRWERGAT